MVYQDFEKLMQYNFDEVYKTLNDDQRKELFSKLAFGSDKITKEFLFEILVEPKTRQELEQSLSKTPYVITELSYHMINNDIQLGNYIR